MCTIAPADRHACRACVPAESGSEGKGGVRNLGKPVALAKKYYDQGADELTFLNITGFRDFPLTDSAR